MNLKIFIMNLQSYFILMMISVVEEAPPIFIYFLGREELCATTGSITRNIIKIIIILLLSCMRALYSGPHI